MIASGRPAVEGRTGFEISSASCANFRTRWPPVPPGLWGIIQRCLTKEPMQRISARVRFRRLWTPFVWCYRLRGSRC